MNTKTKKPKRFLYDEKLTIDITYNDLVQRINREKYYYPYLQTNRLDEFFINLIISLIIDQGITVLDFDLTRKELEETLHDLHLVQKKIPINISLTSIEKLYQRFSNIDQWTIHLFTSGTTGIPKKVAHHFNAFTKTVRHGNKYRNHTWGLAYNPTHIAGLQVFFQAFLNRNPIINLFQYNRAEVFRLIHAFQITHISATPTFYKLLLPPEQPLVSVKRITYGGEKFDSHLNPQLAKIFPNAKINNIYATTEAGTILAADGEIFSINPGNSDRVTIENNELLIHKSLLGLHVETGRNNWYHTGDMVTIISENPLQFKFSQRKNEMINVGGYKVNPYEVEETLTRIPGIRLAQVYGKKNPVLGHILCANVETETMGNDANLTLTEVEIRKVLSRELQDFKIPRIITFVEKIELTRTGKVKRT
jgi:acyl-CoA synthetase (AMP-forming)/AMP-acid ligase II